VGRATYALALGGLRKGDDTRAADPDLSDDDRTPAREKSARTPAALTWISACSR
jgi:hypothetical protein